MANPFQIQSGLSRALPALGGAIGEYKQEQAQTQQFEAQNRIKSELAELFSPERETPATPQDIINFSIKNPEFSAQAQKLFGFTNEQTRPVAQRAYADVMLSSDPQEAASILTNAAREVTRLGGAPKNMMNDAQALMSGDSKALERVKQGAALTDPDLAKRYAEINKTEIKPTANIQDFNRYQELKKSDPKAAEEFATLTGIIKAPDSELKPTTAIQNFEKWQSMPEGEGKTAFGKAIGINPKETAVSVQKKIERVNQKKSEISNASATLDQIDNFLSNSDYVDSVTGYTGRLPTITTSGTDADVAFESMVDNLTLANLDKMSGVLTDRDIQLLANAASGLRPGMSKAALKAKLNKIKKQLSDKIKEASEGIPVSTITAEEPESAKPINEMTDQELLSGF